MQFEMASGFFSTDMLPSVANSFGIAEDVSIPSNKCNTLRKSTVFNDSIRCKQSSGNFVLAPYGFSSLPVEVLDALSPHSIGDLQRTVRIESNGWMWLVLDRVVHAWCYTQPNNLAGCTRSELLLASNNSANSAELVCITDLPSNISGFSLTASGVARYWPNINAANSYLETDLNLKDDICLKAIHIQDSVFIVATQSCRLYQVAICGIGTQMMMSFWEIRTNNLVQGLKRRMSTLFWGHETLSECKGFQQLISGTGHGAVDEAYLLNTNELVKFAGCCGENAKEIYRCDVKTFASEHFGQTVWGLESHKLQNLKCWLLDMTTTRDGIVILVAGLNEAVSMEVYFALCAINAEGSEAPQGLLSFTVLKYTHMFEEDRDDSQITSFRLLFTNGNASYAYVTNANLVICSSVSDGGRIVDTVEFTSTGDHIIGKGQFSHDALFFSLLHGLVSIRPTQLVGKTKPCSVVHESIGQEKNMVQNFNMRDADDHNVEPLQLLKSALIDFTRCKEESACRKIEQLPTHVLTLDQLVVQLSEDMLNEVSDADPRWGENCPKTSTASFSHSMNRLKQLEEKLEAHTLFLKFLMTTTWQRKLSLTGNSDAYWPVLLEHGEKLVVAIALKKMQMQHVELFELVLPRVIEARSDERFKNKFIPCYDIFFIQNALKETNQYRDRYKSLYDAAKGNAICLPWTAKSGPFDLLELLKKQFDLTTHLGLPSSVSSGDTKVMIGMMVELADIALDGFKTAVEYAKCNEVDTPDYSDACRKYDQARSDFIQPLLNREQYESVAALAEKYCDFNSLVELCERSDDHIRLRRYMDQFSSQGFSDFVFRWYVDHGKRGKLMSSRLSSHPELSRFLQTGDNIFMSWIRDINAGDFYHAHRTLFELASKETKCLNKKQTLLSLSKLAAFASDEASVTESTDINAIIRHQALLDIQLQLPAVMDVNSMPVMDVYEIVEALIGDANKQSNEYDFTKALELLQHIKGSDSTVDYKSLLLRIWSQAIKKDTWVNMNKEASVLDTVVFKTALRAMQNDMNMEDCLPYINDLMAYEGLAEHRGNNSFAFCIKQTYEEIHQMMAMP